MTVAWFALAMTIAVLVGIAWVNGRIQNLPAMRDTPIDPTRDASLPAAARDYLDRLDGALGLPTSDRAEIRHELRDHLADSIAAIEAEGLEREAATREALARLGSADELAMQMRHAHRTTRRALAGVGGGIFEAAVGGIQGFFLGALLLYLGFFVAALLLVTVLKGPVDLIAARLPSFDTDSNDWAFNSVLMAGMYALAAWMAGRRAVRTTWRLSRQPASRVKLAWAAGGGTLLTLLVLFVYTALQSSLAVASELAIPVAFVVGAIKFDGRVRAVPSWTWLAIAVAALLLPLLLLASVGGYSSSSSEPSATPIDQTALEASLGRVAPLWPSAQPTSDASDYVSLNFTGANEGGGTSIQRAALAELRDVHLELWRGRPVDPTLPEWQRMIPDRAYSTPYASYPLALSADGSSIDVSLSKIKTHDSLIFVVGFGPDGSRYRLNPLPMSWHGWFSGTVWDWLTASN